MIRPNRASSAKADLCKWMENSVTRTYPSPDNPISYRIGGAQASGQRDAMEPRNTPLGRSSSLPSEAQASAATKPSSDAFNLDEVWNLLINTENHLKGLQIGKTVAQPAVRRPTPVGPPPGFASDPVRPTTITDLHSKRSYACPQQDHLATDQNTPVGNIPNRRSPVNREVDFSRRKQQSREEDHSTVAYALSGQWAREIATSVIQQPELGGEQLVAVSSQNPPMYPSCTNNPVECWNDNPASLPTVPRDHALHIHTIVGYLIPLGPPSSLPSASNELRPHLLWASNRFGCTRPAYYTLKFYGYIPPPPPSQPSPSRPVVSSQDGRSAVPRPASSHERRGAYHGNSFTAQSSSSHRPPAPPTTTNHGSRVRFFNRTTMAADHHAESKSHTHPPFIPRSR